MTSSHKSLLVDIETFSATSLPDCGVYRYASDPDFTILLIAYAFDDEPVELVDVACGEDVPQEFLDALSDPGILKLAYNANFERTCMGRFFNRPMPPEQWQDIMIHAAYLGLPRSLAGVCDALGLGEDQGKMKEGKDLIRYFCLPCKPTKTNGGRTRNLPTHAPDKWEVFRQYCIRDVESERTVERRLSSHPVPESEWAIWRMDQAINDRGVRIDTRLARMAVAMSEANNKQLTEEAMRLTGLENPSSVAQLKRWLDENDEKKCDSLSKAYVSDRLKELPEGTVKRVLTIRKETGKSSVSKYEAMLRYVCSDERIRGMFQHYGASRTGRWAGRGLQPQNLSQNHIPDLDIARSLVRDGDLEFVRLCYGDVNDTLSQLIRTAIIPGDGCLFAVSDFSAIEARLLAWLAGEQWKMDVFANGGDIYCETASQMFGVPVEKHGVNSELRQKGKQATLACGYSGGVGALINMGALRAGIPEEELPEIVDRWRAASPRTVELWHRIDSAAMAATKYHEWSEDLGYGLRIGYEDGMMIIELPSGRRLHYVKPRIGTNRFGKPAVTYLGGTAFTRIETFGGKLTENCLAEGTLVLTEYGLQPIETIGPETRVWDGTEWVTHEGLINQGVRPVIDVDGVRMTPDHKILTEGGWIEGGKADGLNWADVPQPDCYPKERIYATGEDTVAVPLHMRTRDRGTCLRSAEETVPEEIMRLQAQGTNLGSPYPARHEPAPSIRGLALDEAAVYGAEPPSVPQLRGPGDRGVPAMDGQLREFLGGHGADLGEGPRSGQDRQQRGLRAGELPVDEQKAKHAESPEHAADQDTVRDTAGRRGRRADRNQIHDPSIPPGARLARGITVHATGCEEQVYDLRNCGPRHRFAVWNGSRLCIVSNCIQAIGRDCLARAMLKVSERYPIVMHVHDEMIAEVPIEEANGALQYMNEVMAEPIPWAPGLILRGDGYLCGYYRKD